MWIVQGLFEQLWMNVTSSEKCFSGMGQFLSEQQLTAVTASKVAASKKSNHSQVGDHITIYYGISQLKTKLRPLWS